MAPADSLSPPGSSSYDSNTMTVGDGTWDFTKNTFLLPNLMGLNFETMQYNGMANRFSTLTQYHTLILGHGVLAAITFLFIVPVAVMMARFYNRRPGYAVRYHAYLQILALLLTTVVFILGFFAVGPPRNLTNPHHGIGVAIYVMFLLQAVGGRLVKHIGPRRSLRLQLHRWSGRAITILGVVQVPLGLTLYGSPKFTFILYALWMAFLVLVYFILSYRHEGEHEYHMSGGRSVAATSRRRSSGGAMRWIAPLAAGAGAFALLRGRKKDKERERSKSRARSRSRARSQSRARSRSRLPEVIPSRRGSESYVEDEKYTERRRSSGGGLMTKVMGAGAALGAGALLARFMGRRDRQHDEEYSAVATDTPSRASRLQRKRKGGYVESEISEATTEIHRHDNRRRSSRRYSDSGRQSPLLPPPGRPTMAASALSAAEHRPGAAGGRPITPRPIHAHSSRFDSVDQSDYSSYVSPSARTPKKNDRVSKGLLAGLGLGGLGGLAWFRKKNKDREKDEEMRFEEEDRRAGGRPPRFTGDGHPSPTRRESRRRVSRPPAAPAPATVSVVTEDSSSIEPRHGPVYDAAVPGRSAPPVPVPVPITPGGPGRSRSRSRPGTEHTTMPAMPPDPRGILHRESGSEEYYSPGGQPHRRQSSRRRREGESAAAAAAAGMVAAEEEERHRRDRSRDHPVSVKVKVHDDRGNVTLRRLTEEEAARENRHRRTDSVSTLSDRDTPSNRRYRRASSAARRRAETKAESEVEDDVLPPLSPPNPAFAAGRRPKDSAYYSGPGVAGPSGAGPSGSMPGAGATVSSFGSPGSHSAWSPSPSGVDQASAAAERRRRRRLERREGSRPGTTVDFT
ncbi:hypothetical protein GQ53DRAFT_842990 [Thozetella sp. PMI_491]|nr:hypothetical protein GQ53DRAFT_842990 [Thozetella sp. PMI_491]